MALSISVITISWIAYRIVMQDRISKYKIVEAIHKSLKSMKIFSLEIFRLYSIENVAILASVQRIEIVYIVVVCHTEIEAGLINSGPRGSAFQTFKVYKIQKDS